MERQPIRVTVWGEFIHERESGEVASLYPLGMHEEIASAIRELADQPVDVRTARLDEDGQGLPDEVLDQTDVLVWWGHVAHERVSDELAARVQARVLRGMGFVVLHSASQSKPFLRLNGLHLPVARS